MTRFLSEALQAPEPFFRQGLHKLEAANGRPAADIRLSTEVKRATEAKILELGLDPRDTTPTELYHVLQERIKADDARLERTLRTKAATHISAEADVVDGMVHVLNELPDSKRCFALKASVFKSLIRQVPPRKTLKRLGYRSLDSLLKHESPAAIMAAATLSEDSAWQKRLLNQYQNLGPRDFENRNIAILQPNGKGWRQLSETAVAETKHNLLAFKELGALVFLPLPADKPAGTTTVSLSLALHELNEIRTGSSFLKLCQVRPDFGLIVRNVATDEPHLQAHQLDRPVPWNIIQRYYAMARHDQTAFEPHLEIEDMAWHAIEKALSAIEPSLSFWRHSSHLGLIHKGAPISLNIVDAALNCCNQLPFERRLAHFFQRSLWHELTLRYLRHDTVEQAISSQLQPQLAEEVVSV